MIPDLLQKLALVLRQLLPGWQISNGLARTMFQREANRFGVIHQLGAGVAEKVNR
jgi:hypothetical protein